MKRFMGSEDGESLISRLLFCPLKDGILDTKNETHLYGFWEGLEVIYQAFWYIIFIWNRLERFPLKTWRSYTYQNRCSCEKYSDQHLLGSEDQSVLYNESAKNALVLCPKPCPFHIFQFNSSLNTNHLLSHRYTWIKTRLTTHNIHGITTCCQQLSSKYDLKCQEWHQI